MPRNSMSRRRTPITYHPSTQPPQSTPTPRGTVPAVMPPQKRSKPPITKTTGQNTSIRLPLKPSTGIPLPFTSPSPPLLAHTPRIQSSPRRRRKRRLAQRQSSRIRPRRTPPRRPPLSSASHGHGPPSLLSLNLLVRFEIFSVGGRGCGGPCVGGEDFVEVTFLGCWFRVI